MNVRIVPCLCGMLLWGTMLALCVVPVASAAQASPSAPAADAGSPVRQATSGDEALDNAVAAVLVSTLGRQFDGEAIALRIDSVQLGGTGQRDRVVSGEGRMRLGDDPEWIPFRYRTLYDTTFGNAGDPELTFGGIGGADRSVPNDALLVRQLEDRVLAELDASQGGGSRLQLDRIATVQAGHRLLRIDASGLADFGLRGDSPIRIGALYDTRTAQWRRVEYELAPPGGLR